MPRVRHTRRRVRWDNPETVSLFEIDDKFPGGIIPLIRHTEDMTEESVDATFHDRMSHLLTEQIHATVKSLLEGFDEPQTVLHALILEEGLSIGGIAAHLHKSPESFKPELGVLVETRWVESRLAEADNSARITHYSLRPL